VKEGMKTLLLLVTITAGIAGAQTIPQRERDQQARIAQGVRSGQLTPAETARLEREQRAIARKVRRDRVDGGGMTAQERARDQRLLNRSSRDIARLKHNDRTR
jgi:hypothetical protein